MTKENILFLGFAIPDNEMKKVFLEDMFPSVQNHKFNWNIIKGIEGNKSHYEFTYISMRPVSDYPYYKKRIIKKNEWTEEIDDKKIEILEIPYLNVGLLKIISRFIIGLYYSFKIFSRKKAKKAVISYTVHVPIMAIGYIISKIYKIEFITIWADPPSVKHKREGRIKTILRGLELTIAKKIMAKSSKVIALTEDLAKDFAPEKPYLVIEGIIDEKEICSDIKINNNNNRKIIVYTGSLEKKYGIKNIVDGIQMINNLNIEFHIYGRGDYEEELQEICRNDKRIKYKGFISNDEILNVQRSADFLINARSPEDEYVKYSFPSKNIEYMASGTPFISTMLPGMPKEYGNYIYILENNLPGTIKEKLEELLAKEENQHLKKGREAQQYIYTKNYMIQGKKIIQFIGEKICNI